MSAVAQASERRRVLGDALLSPAALLSLGVLVVNDHVLKCAFPGVVTGKLSDAAGMVLFPLLLHALVEIGCAALGYRLDQASRRARRATAWLCAGLTALGFAAIKLSPGAAELYRASLGALQCAANGVTGASLAACKVHLVRDATDLVALPLAFVAVWLMEPGKRALS